jgi:circadian clock protein KaiB
MPTTKRKAAARPRTPELRKSPPLEAKRKLQSAGKLERVGSRAHKAEYVLRLYVSGSTSKSATAIETIKRICEEHLKDRYDLQVIDIFQQPYLARDEQIVAVPTLVKRLPAPQRRLIGDLSNLSAVLVGLDLGMPEK